MWMGWLYQPPVGLCLEMWLLKYCKCLAEEKSLCTPEQTSSVDHDVVEHGGLWWGVLVQLCTCHVETRSSCKAAGAYRSLLRVG